MNPPESPIRAFRADLAARERATMAAFDELLRSPIRARRGVWPLDELAARGHRPIPVNTRPRHCPGCRP